MFTDNLPTEFLVEMKRLLNSEYEEFLACYDDEPLSGLRVNRNKISVEDFIKCAPYDIKRIPFVENGFYINPSDGWTKHPFYYAGLYYIQEPSAMLPADRIRVSEGDRVLDLCAAPGGKSTELATKNCSVLVSNDISFTRAIPLVKNLSYCGAANSFVTCNEPEKLQKYWGEYFDKILVDAPCSGEGMFRRDPSLIKAWIDKRPQEYSDIQKNILEAAYKMLKPGGSILYSTCTFSPVEDEEVIAYILENHEDMKLADIEPYEGFSYGYEEYVKVNPELKKCVHVFPHKMNGEGHFLALLHKHKNDAEPVISSQTDKRVKTFTDLPAEIKQFADEFSKGYRSLLEDARFIIDDNKMVFMMNNSKTDVIKGVHYLRTGTAMGEINKAGKFIPHTALALSIKVSDFKNVLVLSSDDERCIKYLKGETLVIEEDVPINKGIVLIAVDGFPLGFGKFDGSRIKNLYEKGWRLN